MSGFFDHVYSENERYWWHGAERYSPDPEAHASSLITQQTLRYALPLKPGRLLDVGAGEGADSIRMALLGWEVLAVEISSAAVNKIQRFAALAGASVEAQLGDIQSLDVQGTFDLIICNGVLHYVDDKRGACEKLQSLTSPGGANVISLWSAYTPVPSCHQIVPTFPDSEKGEVYSAYSDWRKSFYYLERNKLENSHGDMPGHGHSFIKMLAHKGTPN